MTPYDYRKLMENRSAPIPTRCCSREIGHAGDCGGEAEFKDYTSEMRLKRGSDRYIGGATLTTIFVFIMLAIAAYGLVALSHICQGQCAHGDKACQTRCFDKGHCPMERD